uniref:Uncharacterized protein n=1 Tax=Sinocyclocheilus rhinocerous TaxID=307959 RepID=A0A673FNN7_9TELE
MSKLLTSDGTNMKSISFSILSDPADVISTVEFNQTGEFLATGDKGGRVVIFQREPQVRQISDKHIFYASLFHKLPIETGS